MTCRRAFEIDLLDFIAHGDQPDWAAFRAHYPGCAPCAAEVRAWTELDRLLAGGADEHPAAAALARFAETPARLAVPERERLERHLAACAPCRDELRALRRFDFGVLDALPAPARVPAPARPGLHSRALAALRALVLHPAFAYAVLLLVLVPTLARRREPAAPATVAAPAERKAQEQPLAKERAVAVGSGVPRAEAPAPAEAPRRAAEEERALVGRSDTQAVAALADTPPPPGAPPGWTVLSLRADTPAEVAAASLGRGLVLRLPVAPGGDVRVRVTDASGRRELGERITRATGAAAVELRVPAVWLVPGAYRIEAQPLDGASPAAAFALRVR